MDSPSASAPGAGQCSCLQRTHGHCSEGIARKQIPPGQHMEGLLPEEDSKPAFLHTNSSGAGWVGRAAEQWLPAAPSDSSMSWPGPRAVLAWKECRDCSQIRCEQQQLKRKELVWVGCGHCELGQDRLEQGWEGGSLYTSPFPGLGRRLLSSKRNKGTKHRDPAGATAQGGGPTWWQHPHVQLGSPFPAAKQGLWQCHPTRGCVRAPLLRNTQQGDANSGFGWAKSSSFAHLLGEASGSLWVCKYLQPQHPSHVPWV